MGDRGPTTNPSKEALIAKRQFGESLRQDVETNDIAVVVGYDHLKGTVDVAIKNDPLRQVIVGVPVLGQGGFHRTYQGLGRNVGTNEGDRRTVGLLVFPKLDARRAFDDFRRRQAPSARLFMREGAVFIPDGVFIKNDPNTPDTVPPNLVADGPGEAHEVAPKDRAIIFDPDTGAGIILKDGSSRIVIYGDGIDFIRIGQTEADLLNVARSGEASGLSPTTGTAFVRSTT